MFNYVSRFLSGKAGANTGTTLPTIAVGDILFLKASDSTVLDAASIAALGDNSKIVVAMGLALGKPRLSSPFSRREVHRITRQPSKAKVEQIDEVTTAMVAGKRYRLIVVLKDEMRVISNRQTKLEIPEFLATADTASDLAKLAAQVTKFRATQGMLAGSVVAGKLRITGLPVPAESVLDEYQFVAFSTSFVEIDDANPGTSTGTLRTTTTIQKADGGQGLPAQMAKLEADASGYLGNNDLRSFDRLPNASRLDNQGQYDVYHVISFDKHQGDHEFTMESPVQTTIVVPTGSVATTFVETMLEAFKTKTAAPVITDDAGLDEDNPEGLS